jgi:F-type H+-transporting ATPase subunit b
MHELIFPVLNFSVLVFILFYFLKSPVRNMITQRQAQIKTLIDEAQIQRQEAEKAYKEYEKKLQNFQQEADEILNSTRQDGENFKNQIILQAKAMSERLIRDAEATVSFNVQEYKDRTKQEVVSRAIVLAEKLIQDRFSNEDHERIINEYVGKV